MSRDPKPTADDLRREIQAIFDEACGRALALIAANTEVLAAAPRWMKLKAAAGQVGMHPDTLTSRARRYGLGRQEGRRGQWWIDMNRVEAWLQNRPYQPIPPGDREDSADQGLETGNIRDDASRVPAAESDEQEG